MLEELGRRRRGSETVHSDEGVGISKPFIPALSNTGFDRDPRRVAENGMLIGLRLRTEKLERRHRNDGGVDTILRQSNSGIDREPDFAWLYILRGYAESQIEALALAEGAQPAEADFQKAETLLAERPQDELRYVLLNTRGLFWLQRRELHYFGPLLGFHLSSNCVGLR